METLITPSNQYDIDLQREQRDLLETLEELKALASSQIHSEEEVFDLFAKPIYNDRDGGLEGVQLFRYLEDKGEYQPINKIIKSGIWHILDTERSQLQDFVRAFGEYAPARNLADIMLERYHALTGTQDIRTFPHKGH